MNLQEEIKKMKERGRNNPPSIQKMMYITTAALVEGASQNAFKLFQDSKFRKLADFDVINQTEQDRIFNELVLAYLIILMFIFEAPDLRIDVPLKEYFLVVKDNIPKAYINKLKELGIEKKYLSDWERLIDMRYKEYSKDKLELRGVAMDIETKDSTLTTDKLNDIQLLLPVQTVAIGCHHHICRSKTEGKDELFKLILHFLSKFYVEIRITAEGGKITFWKKLFVKMKRVFNIFKS